MVTDPVCGMKVDEKSAAIRAEYQRAIYEGKAYYFCSEQCKREFERQPERYIPISVK